MQPAKNSPGSWKYVRLSTASLFDTHWLYSRTEYRALEGFVLAVSPFNFTAIGGNLCAGLYSFPPRFFLSLILSTVPALVGNVVVWKPSPMATYANYLTHKIFLEAGVPPSVIQFVPGPPAEVVQQALRHPSFAALHFTGSTFVFKQLWKDIAANLDVYKGYPRIVGETGGKNFHVVHESAEVKNAVLQAVRGAFEYSGVSHSFVYQTVSHHFTGQKCSALSRLYVSSSVWKGGFKDQLLKEVAKIKVGGPDDWSNFLGPVM